MRRNCLAGFGLRTQFAQRIGARPKFFGQAAAARLSLQLMISDLWLFSKRHSTASRALAPAFDQRHPDCSNRFPTMRLQAPSRRRIRPAIRVRGRGRSAFCLCWPRSSGCRPRRLLPELRPADGAVQPVREDAEEGTPAAIGFWWGSTAPEFRCSRARSRARLASRRAPTPCSPANAASKACVGPTSSNGGLVAVPSAQKMGCSLENFNFIVEMVNCSVQEGRKSAGELTASRRRRWNWCRCRLRLVERSAIFESPAPRLQRCRNRT